MNLQARIAAQAATQPKVAQKPVEKKRRSRKFQRSPQATTSSPEKPRVSPSKSADITKLLQASIKATHLEKERQKAQLEEVEVRRSLRKEQVKEWNLEVRQSNSQATLVTKSQSKFASGQFRPVKEDLRTHRLDLCRPYEIGGFAADPTLDNLLKKKKQEERERVRKLGRERIGLGLVPELDPDLRHKPKSKSPSPVKKEEARRSDIKAILEKQQRRQKAEARKKLHEETELERKRQETLLELERHYRPKLRAQQPLKASSKPAKQKKARKLRSKASNQLSESKRLILKEQIRKLRDGHCADERSLNLPKDVILSSSTPSIFQLDDLPAAFDGISNLNPEENKSTSREMLRSCLAALSDRRDALMRRAEAATKIQALIRGFIIRRSLRRGRDDVWERFLNSSLMAATYTECLRRPNVSLEVVMGASFEHPLVQEEEVSENASVASVECRSDHGVLYNESSESDSMEELPFGPKESLHDLLDPSAVAPVVLPPDDSFPTSSALAGPFRRTFGFSFKSQSPDELKPRSVSFDDQAALDELEEEPQQSPEDFRDFIEDFLHSEIDLFLEKTGSVQLLQADLIPRYLQALFEMLEPQTEEFLELLNNPEEPDFMELISTIQTAEIGAFSEPPVLELYIPGHFSIEINRLLGVRRSQLDQDSLNQAFANSLYHVVNEGLNYLRRGGINGIPPVWSSRTLPSKQYDSLQTVFKDLEQLLYNWDSLKAGTVSYNFLSQAESIKREDKLSTWLCSTVKEEEKSWLEYESEELQVKLDVADLMLECLVEETLQLLNDV